MRRSRPLTILGFAAIIAGLPFTWFTLVPEPGLFAGPAIFEIDGTHFEDRVEALLVLALGGAIFG